MKNTIFAILAIGLLAACTAEQAANINERIDATTSVYQKAKQAGCENLSEMEKEQIRKLYPDPSKSICPEI